MNRRKFINRTALTSAGIRINYHITVKGMVVRICQAIPSI